MLIFKIVIQLYSSQYKPCNETNAYNFTLKKKCLHWNEKIRLFNLKGLLTVSLTLSFVKRDRWEIAQL